MGIPFPKAKLLNTAGGNDQQHTESVPGSCIDLRTPMSSIILASLFVRVRLNKVSNSSAAVSWNPATSAPHPGASLRLRKGMCVMLVCPSLGAAPQDGQQSSQRADPTVYPPSVKGILPDGLSDRLPAKISSTLGA